MHTIWRANILINYSGVKQHKHQKQRYRIPFLILGSALASIGLEIFLIPNNIIDGGIVGISIMASYLTHIPIGLYITLLNIPFLVMGYRHIGKTFVFSSLFSILALSAFVTLLHPVPGLTQDIMLAAVFGGIILGVGVGLIIRYGGSLDGTEMVAIIMNKQSVFSVGETVMIFNIFILSSAGLIFGWDRAMYSLITYFIAYKTIDITVEGLEEAKAAMIISDHFQDIAEAIQDRLGRKVTYLFGSGIDGAIDRQMVIYAVITRLEVAKLRAIIMDKDPEAFVTIHDVSEVVGGKHKKQKIH